MSQSSETTILFRTNRSSLLLHSLDEKWVEEMKIIAEEVDGLLDHRPEIFIYGKPCHMNRSVGFFSNLSEGYRYSGQMSAAKPLTERLATLLAYINQRFRASYNGILINKYLNGEDSISKHSDDEHALDPECGVMAISVGAVRKFRVRTKANSHMVVDIPTEPSQIINMTGDFQKEFTHEIPVEKKVKEVRYSFTFRRHLK